jgi:uncharacterized protein YndB with AHSA1/START domain
MILKDKIQIDRPPDVVWRHLRSPAQMKEWDPKIKAVVPVSWGEPAEGYRYRVRLRMNGREGNFLAEFLEFQQPARLRVHLSGGSLPVKGYFQEVFELTENAGGTLLRHSFEQHNSGRQLLFNCLILFIHYSFSRFSRKKHLRALKELVEAT